MHKYCGLILSALVTSSIATSAGAQQYMSFGFAGPGDRQSPEVNLFLSARYDRLLQTNPAFRAFRMRKECNPIGLPELHGDCLASFDQYEPMIVR